MVKQYIGLSLDTSASMRPLAAAAARDYNQTIAGIREASTGVDTIISVVRCGVGNGLVEREIVNSSILALSPLNESAYDANGRSTPLLDSCGELIDMFTGLPDANNPDVSFLIMSITDGEENSSKRWTAPRLADKIRTLQATDRWTFVFRVPRGYSERLSRLCNIPIGNIQEWDQTVRGLEQSTNLTNQAFQSYYSGLRSGVKSTTRFYSDLSNVSPVVVRSALDNISHRVQQWDVYNRSSVKEFVESKLGRGRFVIGTIFYPLMKAEDVQGNKLIAIRDRDTGAIYSGAAARDLLHLPRASTTIRVHPGDHGQFDIYVQSTSNNRILPAGTSVLYWPTAQ